MSFKLKSLIPRSRWCLWSVVLFSAILCVGTVTVGDYGMSWDEPFRFKGGDSQLAYYSDLVSGKGVSAQTSSYPGLFDLPLAIVHEAFPELGTRSQKGHIWSFCFGLIGLLSIWRVTARIGGERAGFFGLLLLATVPRYYGHMFFNPKDIPLAGMYALGVWAVVSLLSRLPKPAWRYVIAIGLAAGLALSARIAGFLVLCYFGLFIALFLIAKYGGAAVRGQAIDVREVLSDVGVWALRGAVSGGGALAVLLIFWPTLHVNPFAGAGNALETVQSYGWGGRVLMDGHFWDAQDLPIYYIPYWLMLTVPVSLQLLFLTAIVLGVSRLVSYARGAGWPSAAALLSRAVPVFAVLFPLAYLLYKDPTLYDGMRHYLFILPPMACVCALALEWLIRKASQSGKRYLALVLQGGVGVAVLFVVADMVALHPYQYLYFNRMSGGLPAAYTRDETDYWGLSHKEAAEWLNEYVETLDPGGRRIFKVHLRYSRWMLQEHLNPERFEMSKERDGADFFVSVTRFNLHQAYPEAEVLHVVERQGVPLCFVFKLSDQ
ncbi:MULTISPECIES: glycosyltransferase family 39 protein [unclassified Lentimonas]|uniref:glycosyltransferase family 39 protein n=1 Tax=unclassified Lentimonas TaxID=2630993 RepID=UPI0013284A9B|nr:MULTISPECIES: glycosyltransferase family 39 protein [unclassified Lentimonas]CAA6691132.1 Unannotated [Lentimonas sp. CC10]CAA6693763.1 Unannotated [Lentimonas sp. CC19]CAA7070133.1 Unannotated [Lentimonas sp. CC11]